MHTARVGFPLGARSFGVLALLVGAASTYGCLDDDPGRPGDDPVGGSGAGAGGGANGGTGAGATGATGGDGGNGGSGGSLASICEEPTGEPIVHTGSMNVSETWNADSLHVVEGIFQVRDGSTLTLAPCAQVRMGAAAGFDMPATNNSIVAAGEANARVRIYAEDPAVGWGSIRVLPTSTLDLSYTTIEDGAHDPPTALMRSVIDVFGVQTDPVQPLLHVNNVEILNAGAVGVTLTENAGFTPDSTGLVITGAGLYPVRVWPSAITNIPDGDYTGNERDEIVIVGRPLTIDATMRDRGVRYLVGDELSFSELTVAATEGVARLTMEAGVELAFKAGGILVIENFTGDFPASGALVAVGTEQAPIHFTTNAPPAPGAWIGLYFGGIPDPSNQIEHAVIEYAGGENGTSGFSCSDLGNGENEGAVIILGEPAGAFVQDTHIAHSAGFGVDRGWDGADIDFLATNTFDDIAWCLQSAPHDDNHACPANPPCPTR